MPLSIGLLIWALFSQYTLYPLSSFGLCDAVIMTPHPACSFLMVYGLKEERIDWSSFLWGWKRESWDSDHHGRVNKPLEEVDSDAVGQEHPSCQPGKHFRVVAVVMAHHHAP